MLTFIAALATVRATPEIAYVARYYSDKSSRFQLYVRDLNASKSRMLSTVESPNQVAWVGSNRLAWTTETGVWTSALKPWAPKRIYRGRGNFGFVESKERVTPPGQPIIQVEDSPKFQIDSSGKLVPAKKYVLDGAVNIDQEQPSTITSPVDPSASFSFTPFEGFSFTSNGTTKAIENGVVRAWKSGNRFFLQSWAHDSTTGSVSGLYVNEPGKGLRAIFENVNSFDFVPDRNLYACTTLRTLSPLGKKKVWTSQVYTGDWQSGAKKPIITGMVWVSNVSLRPLTR